MIRSLLGLAALMAAMMPSTTAFAQDDDWEYEQDPSRALSVAAARYEAGLAIMVQCRQGGLTAALVGLPPELDSRIELQATRADGRNDVQTWLPAGAPGLMRSNNAARDVRFLRGGGAYTIWTPEGDAPPFRTTFDLPTEHANLDRVLTDCGWPVTDERDLLARAGSEVSLAESGPSIRTARIQGRPRARGSARPDRSQPSAPPPPRAEAQISCIIHELRLTECRADHPPAPDAPPGAVNMERLNGGQVEAPDGVPVEGKVMFLYRPLLVVVREELIG